DQGEQHRRLQTRQGAERLGQLIDRPGVQCPRPSDLAFRTELELVDQLAQRIPRVQYLVYRTFRLLRCESEAVEQCLRLVHHRTAAQLPVTQQGQAQIDQIGVLMVLTVIVRIMLVADGSAYLQRHVPVAHQPAADLIPIDPEQMLIYQPGRHVGVGLHMSADELEMRREDIGQQQVAEVVQQPGQIAQARFGAALPRYQAGQTFDHRRGVDGLLPVRGGTFRGILGHAEGLAQRQSYGQVEYQIEPQYPDDGVLHRAYPSGG